jgi:hypothetical protein
VHHEPRGKAKNQGNAAEKNVRIKGEHHGENLLISSAECEAGPSVRAPVKITGIPVQDQEFFLSGNRFSYTNPAKFTCLIYDVVVICRGQPDRRPGVLPSRADSSVERPPTESGEFHVAGEKTGGASMSLMKSLIAICCLAALTGCAALLQSKPEDPSGKLREAVELFSSKDEPVEAEELLHDVVEVYLKNQDDLGLAEAYRQFGLFYRSNAVNKFEKYYLKEGFLDKTVKFSTRYEKAIEYFNKARDIFAADRQYAVLSNLQLSIAKTYDLMNQHENACLAFDQGLENHLAFKKSAAPEALELRADEIANYEQYIGTMKKQAGCP